MLCIEGELQTRILGWERSLDLELFLFRLAFEPALELAFLNLGCEDF